jgi:hypothetical protein
MGTKSTMKPGRGVGSWVSCLLMLGACGSRSPSTEAGPGVGPGGMTGRVPANHRPAAVACPMDRPVGTCPGPDAGYGAAGRECNYDNECNDGGQNGRCEHIYDPTFTAGLNTCNCSYDSCFSDADCHEGGPCGCRVGQSIANGCWAGNCRVDADCGPGGYCSLSPGDCLGAFYGYYCHTRKDACVNDVDCGINPNGTCRYNSTISAWSCTTNLRVCGE